MSSCPFCSIVAAEAPAHRLYEDDRTLAFLDVAPATRGHALVVPKAHHETLTDMPESLAGATYRTAHRVATAVESCMGLDGSNVLQANGEAAGQDVWHAHVHVIPRYEDDSVDIGWPAGATDDRDRREIAATIRNEVASRS